MNPQGFKTQYINWSEIFQRIKVKEEIKIRKKIKTSFENLKYFTQQPKEIQEKKIIIRVQQKLKLRFS